MKALKAIKKIYLYHFIMVLVSVILVVPLWNLVQAAPLLFSIMTALIYCMVMYSVAWNIGRLDARKIPGFFPNRKLPIWIALWVSVLPIALLIFRLTAPGAFPTQIPVFNGEYEFFLAGNKIYGTPDLIYRLWFFPFEAFIPSGNILAYFLVLLPLPALIIAGYMVGLTKFRIFDAVWSRVVFSKAARSKNEHKSSLEALKEHREWEEQGGKNKKRKR